MKVKFLKDHFRHKKGEKASLIDAAANYFIKCGVAVKIKDSFNAPEPEVKTRGRKKK